MLPTYPSKASPHVNCEGILSVFNICDILSVSQASYSKVSETHTITWKGVKQKLMFLWERINSA